MKRTLAAAFLIFMFTGAAIAGETQLEKAANVVHEIMSAPDRGIPQDLLQKSVCVGIVPSELKGPVAPTCVTIWMP